MCACSICAFVCAYLAMYTPYDVLSSTSTAVKTGNESVIGSCHCELSAQQISPCHQHACINNEESQGDHRSHYNATHRVIFTALVTMCCFGHLFKRPVSEKLQSRFIIGPSKFFEQGTRMNYLLIHRGPTDSTMRRRSCLLNSAFCHF